MISISVITCLYNTPPELFKNYINGLLNQTFTNFEVLIVNDGSTKYLNENLKIIEDLNDDRFKYFDTKHTGKSQTLNFALNIAKGKYVAINDSDDISLPERLEYQYDFLQQNKEYDAISNAMISFPTNIIFPGIFDSSPVKNNEIHYKISHPSMMFNREKVLNNVPFLFEQIYDSMEDNVFNHIMYYNGIKFYYDNNILVKYSCKNLEAAHYENLYGYKKEGAFKLFFKTFNANKHHTNSNFTCILIANSDWREELEKTILNIRFTACNVKILIALYEWEDINKSYYDKYDVIFTNNNTSFVNAFSDGIKTCDTKYLMIISKPVRFYNQNWDNNAIDYFECINEYEILQPYMTGIQKIDRDNYFNENGKIEHNTRTGLNFILLDNIMTEKRDNIDFYSEYSTTARIPILDNDLIFIAPKNELMRIYGSNGFDNDILLNVFLSIKEYLCGGQIKINADIKCGIMDGDIYKYTDKEYYNLYYTNMWKIALFFLNETKFIYEKIIYDNIKNKEDAKNIINSVLTDETFLTYINVFNKNENKIKDVSYFLKNINLKYNIWSLTNAI